MMGTEPTKKQKMKEKKEDKRHKQRDLENAKPPNKIEEETNDRVNVKKKMKKKKTMMMRKEVQGSNVEISNHSQISVKVDCNKKGKIKKDKLGKKRKIQEKNDIATDDQLGTDGQDGPEEKNANLNERTKEKKKNTLRKKKKVEEKTNSVVDDQAGPNAKDGIKEQNGKSKKAKKKNKKELGSPKEKILENTREAEVEEVYYISSGDEDCSRGMKKWVTDYYNSRPGLKILQDRIDAFITAHEERLEQERREREEKAAEGGWTVVVHHKGRKKTMDSETGITVGSVAQAAAEDKMAKKKQKEVVAQDFYRFQKREAHRNEIMMLQSKFEQDRKRIQQLRAARKFKPY